MKLQLLRNWLLYLLVFLLPLQTVYILREPFRNGAKWQSGTIMIYATEVLLWLILLLSGIILFKKNGWRRLIGKFKIKERNFLIILPVWLLIFWSGLSIFWSIDRPLAFYSWFKLLEISALFLIILTADFDRFKVYWALVLAGAIEGVLAISQFVSQTISANKLLGIAGHLPAEIGASVVENHGFWLRAYGSFAHPNILAGFLVVAFFAALFLYLKEEPIIDRFLAPLKIGLILIITGGIFFSFSRSAWLALVLAYGCLFLLLFLKRANVDWRLAGKITVALALLAAIIFIIYQPFILSRLAAKTTLEDISLNRRERLIEQSYQLISARPLSGIGLGNYTAVIWEKFPNFKTNENQPVHNVYLLIMSELGLIGLVIFLGWQAAVLWLAFGRKNYLFLSLALALIIISFFDHYLWTQYAGLLMIYLIFALAVKDDKILNNER